MRRIPAVVLGVLMAFAAVANSHAAGFGVRGVYWFPEISGDIQTTTGGIPDTPIDLKSTLGVEDEDIPFGEAHLEIGRLTLRAGYAQMKFDGANVLASDVTFNGVTYSASERVVSRIDMKMVDADLEFALLRPDAGVASVNLGLLLKVKYVDGEVELSSQTAGSTVEDFRAPVPMVGATLGAGILKNLIRVDLRGAGIGWSGNHLYDLEAYASVIPFPFVRLQGGYRYIDLRIDDEDVRASLKLKGPYAGIQLRF